MMNKTIYLFIWFKEVHLDSSFKNSGRAQFSRLIRMLIFYHFCNRNMKKIRYVGYEALFPIPSNIIDYT